MVEPEGQNPSRIELLDREEIGKYVCNRPYAHLVIHVPKDNEGYENVLPLPQAAGP